MKKRNKQERKVINFGEFREMSTEKFLSCPCCFRQEFHITTEFKYVCWNCNIQVIPGEDDTVVDFKK